MIIIPSLVNVIESVIFVLALIYVIRFIEWIIRLKKG